MQIAGLMINRYRRHMPALMVLLFWRAQFALSELSSLAEQPELEILEPVNASVVRVFEGDNAVMRFGLNFLKGHCEDFSIRLFLNALPPQYLSPCACESLEFYCILTLSLINYGLSGHIKVHADVLDLRSGQVLTHIGAFFDMQVQAGSNCQCHTQECTCRFSYKDLQQHILECDKSMTCTLKPLPPLSSDDTSFSIPPAPQFKQ